MKLTKLLSYVFKDPLYRTYAPYRDNLCRTLLYAWEWATFIHPLALISIICYQKLSLAILSASISFFSFLEEVFLGYLLIFS